MNTKIRCLLLDDELPGLTYLRMLCEQIPNLEVVKAFDDPQKLLDNYPNLDFDICILDIEMPKMNGLEVARILNNKPVIFTTAYKEYAADAFDVFAVDYIRKPIDKTRLEKAIQKASLLLEKNKGDLNHFQFNTDKGKSLIRFSQILYITSSELDKRDKVVYLENQQRLTLKNISNEQLLNTLPKSAFCRINKKEIIALRSVSHYTSEIITTNIVSKEGRNHTFAISGAYLDDFKALLAKVK